MGDVALFVLWLLTINAAFVAGAAWKGMRRDD